MMSAHAFLRASKRAQSASSQAQGIVRLCGLHRGGALREIRFDGGPVLKAVADDCIHVRQLERGILLDDFTSKMRSP